MADKPDLVPVDPDTAMSTFGPLEKYRAPDGVQNTVGLKLDYGKPRTDLITWEGLDEVSEKQWTDAVRDNDLSTAALASTSLMLLNDWWTSTDSNLDCLREATAYAFVELNGFVTGYRPFRTLGDRITLHASFSPALLSVGEVLAYGAKKYSARNWENGIMYSRVYGAATRHLMAFLSGEAMDPETRLPHLAHAACCLMFLLTFEARGQGGKLDDRPFVKNGEATP